MWGGGGEGRGVFLLIFFRYTVTREGIVCSNFILFFFFFFFYLVFTLVSLALPKQCGCSFFCSIQSKPGTVSRLVPFFFFFFSCPFALTDIFVL